MMARRSNRRFRIPSVLRVTPFQAQVYEAVKRIPRGWVSTYHLVAKAIGCGSAQAVGQALRANPFAPHVPCHRVIASNGTLGGFRGSRHAAACQRKRQLLAQEGILFRQGRLADPTRIFTFSTFPSSASSAEKSSKKKHARRWPLHRPPAGRPEETDRHPLS